MTDKERVRSAISIYKAAVKNALKAKKNIFYITLSSPVVLLIAVIVSWIYENIGAILASLGVGGVNLGAIWGTVGSEVKKYLAESNVLNQSIEKLNLELELCADNDSTCINKVGDTLKEYMDKLSQIT